MTDRVRQETKTETEREKKKREKLAKRDWELNVGRVNRGSSGLLQEGRCEGRQTT